MSSPGREKKMKQTRQPAGMDATRRRIAGGGALGLLALVAGCGGGNTEKESDAVIPTLVISSDTPDAATGSFTVRFTFSAAISGFTTAGITVSNGFTSASVVKLSDTVYTVQVTPTTSFQGVAELRVLVGAFKDATGTVANTVAYAFGQQINTVVATGEPTLTITHNVSTATATGPVTFTLQFSEDVSGSFSVSDIQLSAGAVSSFTTNTGGALYSAVVTLPTGTTGDLVLRVPAGSFQTAAGVANQKAYSRLLPFVVAA